ncbi:hypothetical protein [Devosia chinhatensis]|uniref:SnoaL-like domain-containing protein n=1 Tax=Devosia chinhatensis TaxID=429727 RepID=A0A0F5FEQ4_9HYPH|nr:hypothetical protein [Devosia chinhatensis]KKB07341.1 hypothetical protein VE26_11160 [Devosia chinhatensis]
MRKGLAIVVILALAAHPALAQGKTKVAPNAGALSALQTCQTFANGDETAVDAAISAGWDAYEQDAESPFVHSYGAEREVDGLGWGDLFALVETYPDRIFGYCRIDFVEARGNGKAVIDAIAGLDGFEGEVKAMDGGHYASLVGGDSLLLAHWDDAGFVIQLTTITPKLQPADGD